MSKKDDVTLYVSLPWPNYQRFMDEDWWNECAIVHDVDGKSHALIPLSKVFNND